MSFKSFSHY